MATLPSFLGHSLPYMVLLKMTQTNVMMMIIVTMMTRLVMTMMTRLVMTMMTRLRILCELCVGGAGRVGTRDNALYAAAYLIIQPTCEISHIFPQFLHISAFLFETFLLNYNLMIKEIHLHYSETSVS